MTYQFIEYSQPGDHIAAIRLNRPKSLNALNAGTMEEIQQALEVIEQDPHIHVWLLTGAPRPDGRPCFSAGVDLKDVGAGKRMHPALGPTVTNMIDDMLTPSIAVIDGTASTGAMELAIACDLRIVGEAVQISDWHLKHLGTGVGRWGSPTRWIDLIGAARTKEIILTGKVVEADEALRIGFALSVHPSNQLWTDAITLAETIAAMNPEGVKMALAHIQQSVDMTTAQSLAFAPKVKDWFSPNDEVAQHAQNVMKK